MLAAGLVRTDLVPIFGLLGFLSLVFGVSRALACWDVDSLVFRDRGAGTNPRDHRAA